MKHIKQLSVLWFLAAIFVVQHITTVRADSYQPITLRSLSQKEQALLYLSSKLKVDDVRKLNKIIQAESSWNQNAHNKETGDWGYFQINEKTWDSKAKELNLDYKNNWKDNIETGILVAKEQGASAWSASYHIHHVKSLSI